MASLPQLLLPFFPLLIFVIFLWKWRGNSASKPRKRSPPSPRKLPCIGNLHQLGNLPHRSLHRLSQQYGPLMLLHFGKVPVLVASSADAAREIMKTQDFIFSSRPKSSMIDKITYGSKDVAFSPYGEYWRQMRSICVLQLLGTKKVQSFSRIREEETSNMIEEIRVLGSSAVNLSRALTAMNNNVICRAALGRKYGDDGEGRDFKKLLEDFGAVLGSFSVGDYIPWLSWVDRLNGLNALADKVASEFDAFLEEVMKEHRNEEEEKKGESDFVNILLDFQRANKDSALAIEDDAIKALIVDMFAAGTDTTTDALIWTASELLRHPDSMKKLQKEVRDIAGGDRIRESHLESMHYLKAVMKEALRLHPPAPLLVPRELTKDTKLMGYDLDSGTQVIVNAWAIGHDPSSWNDPKKFHPERFLESSIDYKGLDFELIPFGAGRRGCPGIAFGMTTNELALAKLVQSFDLRIPNGLKEDGLDMSEVSGITVHRKSDLIIVTV